MKRTMGVQLLVAVVLVVIAAGCGGNDDETAAPSTTTTTTPVRAVEATVDWRARTVSVDGLDGYEIDFCEGEAPILCVTRGGEWIGGIELASFPGGAEALEDGVEAWAAEHYGTIEADRVQGCDPDYEVTPDEVEAVPFGSLDGYRYGFTGTVDGRAIERVVGIGAADGGDLRLLVMNALVDDGCLARESELPLDAASDLAPALDALAAGTTALPAVDAPPAEGGSTGWLRDRSAASIELDEAEMLSGEEAIDAARDDGQLPPDGELPNDFYIDDDSAAVTVLPVSQDVTVSLYVCTAGCELRDVDAQAFLRGEIDAYGGDEPLVNVEVRDGAVVSIEEVYMP